MNLIKKDYVTIDFPENEIEKSYEKVVYKNIRFKNNKYISDKYLLNPLEYQKYMLSKEYSESELLNGQINMVGKYTLKTRINDFDKIQIIYSYNESISMIELVKQFDIINFKNELIKLNAVDNLINIQELLHGVIIKKIIGIK